MQGIRKRQMQGVQDQGKTEDESSGPDDDEQQKRERSVIAEGGLPFSGVTNSLGYMGPRPPGKDVEDAGDAKASRCAARENYSLESIQKRGDDARDSETKREDVQGAPQLIRY